MGDARTVDWAGELDGAIVIVDQCALPGSYRTLRIDTVDGLIDAIRRLAVRGAPALGAAGALGVVLAAREPDSASVRRQAERIAAARPTAVNLRWGVERALAALPHGAAAVLSAGKALLDEDERVNKAASANAAELVLRRCGRKPLRILTHCNTGALATVAWGTALGVVWHLHAEGLVEEVLADETRPLLQGARLTAWELAKAGVPCRVLPDSAAASAMAAGLVDCVLVGADRIAANGDVANKIGTYPLAISAARHGIPFVVVAPSSTVDETLASGTGIEIEQRDGDEVTRAGGVRVAPEGTLAYNPAFDVTPAELVTAVVTEHGVRSPEKTVRAQL
ncbi:S-methyl-5-thioribose-1-phosphate isomerase [Saccharomonospora sp. NPDC006951]